MGGSIEVCSELGVGSDFKIRLVTEVESHEQNTQLKVSLSNLPTVQVYSLKRNLRRRRQNIDTKVKELVRQTEVELDVILEKTEEVKSDSSES